MDFRFKECRAEVTNGVEFTVAEIESIVQVEAT